MSPRISVEYHEHPSHGWISPRGKFYYARKHYNFANEYLKYKHEYPVDVLVSRGWVQMMHDSVWTSRALNAKQFKVAQKLAVGDNTDMMHLLDDSIDMSETFVVPVWWFKKARNWHQAVSGMKESASYAEKTLREAWLAKAEREGMLMNPMDVVGEYALLMEEKLGAAVVKVSTGKYPGITVELPTEKLVNWLNKGNFKLLPVGIGASLFEPGLIQSFDVFNDDVRIYSKGTGTKNLWLRVKVDWIDATWKMRKRSTVKICPREVR